MRPALNKLLSRPSSLDLLRCLVGIPAPLSTATAQPQRSTRYRKVALGTDEGRRLCESMGSDGGKGSPAQEEAGAPNATKIIRVSRPLHTATTETLEGNIFLSSAYYEKWSNSARWRSYDDIDFESDLLAPENPSRPRLLDQKGHSKDLNLFARLLDHRERFYGPEGIRTYWEVVKKRGIRLPTRDFRSTKKVGLLSEKLWMTFLKLGFRDQKVLEELCDYADNLLEKHKRRWPRLYAEIVQHFLVEGTREEAVKWHKRLIERHPTDAVSFANLCRQAVHHRGSSSALEIIYDENGHRNAYGAIVPTLAWQEDFKAALDWHFKLIDNGDVPVKLKHAQSLSRFLAIYDRPNAVRVTRSLVEAQIPFDITSTHNDDIKISREVMNLIHGKTFNIPVKPYNDEYGARWFATTWVPLDLAMHSIHALGMQAIGPLSLQALCVRREPDGSDATIKVITERLARLQNIGVSIGNSVFSRAVKYFTRNNMPRYLNDLLHSDQHPDALEDSNHLDHLLASFARTRDWDSYRRTLAIQSISSKTPATEAQNVWLRTHIDNSNLPAAREILNKMQSNGTIVKMRTIAHLVRGILVPRRQGHRPVFVKSGPRDLSLIVALMKGIMDAGSLVPAAYWREILRRLGMEGRQRELHELCMFLAYRYGPSDVSSLQYAGMRRANLYRVPAQVHPSHPLHPLKILFPVGIQMAIVEWGFMNALRRRDLGHKLEITLRASRDANEDMTAGITLLRTLRWAGVDIDGKAMKNAVLNRLITYYGPGQSRKRKNRAVVSRVPALEVTIEHINRACGKQAFDGNMRQIIRSRGLKRLNNRGRKEAKLRERKAKNRPVSSSWAIG